MTRCKKHIARLALAAGLALGAGVAQATVYSFDFSTSTGDLGTVESYTSNGVTLTAYGFEGTFDSTRLWGKHDGGDENGLGIRYADDHEINTRNFVQVNMQNLWNESPASLTLSMGSVQQGESWKIYGSNVLGWLGTLLMTGTTNAPATFGMTPVPTGYKYIGVRAGEGNVLLGSLSASTVAAPVPEPGSLALIASGLLAVVGIGRRTRLRSRLGNGEA